MLTIREKHEEPQHYENIFKFQKPFMKDSTIFKMFKSMAQCCSIYDIELWFDFDKGKLKLPFILPNELNTEYIKHTGKQLSNQYPSYCTELNNLNDLNGLITKSNNMVKNVSKSMFRLVAICENRKNIKSDFFDANNNTNSDFIDSTFDGDFNHGLLKCYQLYGNTSYVMYVAEYVNYYTAVFCNNDGNTIELLYNKSDHKMITLKMHNVFGKTKIIYNFYNTLFNKLLHLQQKVLYYDDPHNFSDSEADNAINTLNTFSEQQHNTKNMLKGYEKNQSIICVDYLNNSCSIKCQENLNISRSRAINLHIKLSGENVIIFGYNSDNYTYCVLDMTLKKEIYTSTSEIITTYKNKTCTRLPCNIKFNSDNIRSLFVCSFLKYEKKSQILRDDIAIDEDEDDDIIIDEDDDDDIIVHNSNEYSNYDYYGNGDEYTLIIGKGCTTGIVYKYDPNIKKEKTLQEMYTLLSNPINILRSQTQIFEIDITGIFDDFEKIDRKNYTIYLTDDYLKIKAQNKCYLFTCHIKDNKITVDKQYNTYFLNNGIKVTQKIYNPTQLKSVLESYSQTRYRDMCEPDNYKNKIHTLRLKHYNKKNYCVVRFDKTIKIYSSVTEYKMKNNNDRFVSLPVDKKMTMDSFFQKLIEIIKSSSTSDAIDFNMSDDEICKIYEEHFSVKFEKEYSCDICLNDMFSIYVSEEKLMVYNGKKTITLDEHVPYYNESDNIIEILEDTEDYDGISFSIDEYNIGYITDNLVFVKKYDRLDKNMVTIHDLRKMNEDKKKEFDKTQSCHLLNKNTELGKFDFVKETGLKKEYLYHMFVGMCGEDLLIQDANNLIIVCGFGDFTKWVGGFFSSSNTVNHNTTNNGQNSKVTHNGKEVFKKENGAILKCDMKIGKITDFPRVVWKVAHIKGTTKYCIIKLVLPEDTTFIRPYTVTNWHGLYKGKSRVNKAVVESIQEYSFEKEILLNGVTAVSSHSAEHKKIEYNVGDLIIPDSFDETNEECSHGIHVFEERDHIVSLTGDEEVKPINVIRKIMPRECNMLVSLAELKIGEQRKKYDEIDESKDETTSNFLNGTVSMRNTLESTRMNPLFQIHTDGLEMVNDQTYLYPNNKKHKND